MHIELKTDSSTVVNENWLAIDNLSHKVRCQLSLVLPDQSKLECDELIRVIPGRRVVCRAIWNGRAVFAKIFMGPSARFYALRDKNGVESLVTANIRTPELLYASDVGANRYVLIFSAIESAVNAESAYRHHDEASRFSLMQMLAESLAKHHLAGIVQSDLHLKNFLVEPMDGLSSTIYTLDGDGIRRLTPFLKKKKRLHNLATLFSKMDVQDDRWIPELYQKYCLLLRVPYKKRDEIWVYRKTRLIRYQVATGYAERKVFRNCTDVKVVHNFKHFLAMASGFEVESSALLSLDQCLVDEQRNIKNGNTCTIAKAQFANRSVIIKRYNIKSFWHGLNRAFRLSRAAISWANAYRLIISNIATPAPLAIVEERFGWLRSRAYFLSEYVDAPDAMQFFSHCAKVEDKKTAARNMAGLFYKLYLLRLAHGDFKASNIKIVDLDPVLLDLDSMQAYRSSLIYDWWFERKHIKDLKRLMKNWEHDDRTADLLKQALRSEYAVEDWQHGKSILIRAGIV